MIPTRQGVSLLSFPTCFIKRVEYDARVEISILQTIQGHPNIIKLIEGRADANFYYIVTELCVMDLQMRTSDRVKENFLPTEDLVKKDFKQIVSAVNFLHKFNIIHGDIKIDNILVRSDDTLALCDFEAADYYKGLTIVRKGTILYLPPEAIVNKNAYDPLSAEVWALGTVLYTITNNRSPYDGGQPCEVFSSMFKYLKGRILSKDYNNLISGMLAFAERDRLNIERITSHKWLN